MFRLVIADDEARIREGFTRIVDWESLGFRVVGCYGDGRQVLEHLRREHVDVVLTDIKMKEIDGLEVAREIKEHYPNTLCVLVSAHQEFDFAHAAIAAGVKDYLFKPTRISDIRRVFSGIAEELERESEFLEQQAKQHQKYEEMNQLWRSQFLYDLYMGALRKTEMADAQAKHYYPECSRHGVLLCFLRFAEDEAQEEMRDSLRRMFQGNMDGVEYDPVSITPGSLAVMSVFDASVEGVEQKFRSHMEDLIAQAMETSGMVLNLQELRRYDSLQAFINRPRFSLRRLEEGIRLDENFSRQILSRQRLMFSYLTSRSMDQAAALICEIVDRAAPFSLEIKHAILIDTAARIQTKLQELELVQQIMPRYDLLMKAQEPSEMIAWLQATMEEWSRSIPASHTPQQVISQIKAYILEHYAGNVSLDAVAEHVFLSSVYVSRLFKQETGENFTDYVSRVRIDKAKELLEHPDILVSDVGQRVGYPNPRYFYRVFKNMTGYTPSGYRSRFGEEESQDERAKTAPMEE